ncbi:MAG: peptidoglycan editing factor PgeF [Candidatus Aminicenantes bacterium]|nr:peptidoglycan editing factor PgeF [Candidatus Aminicenantes bacterium]
MRRKTKARFLTAPLLDAIPGLVHGFGMKGGGARTVPGGRKDCGLRLVFLDQVHSDIIRFYSRPPRVPKPGDAAATDRPGLLPAVKTADCLPVLLADQERRVAAAVHCGWRGTAARLAEKTVRALEKRYGCRPARLRAALGPCIGPRCYEVGEDVRLAFRKAGLPLRVFKPLRGRPGKFALDLAGANRAQLLRAGLRARNIDRLPLCTHCRPDLCSYRRDPKRSGRQINFIGFVRIAF